MRKTIKLFVGLALLLVLFGTKLYAEDAQPTTAVFVDGTVTNGFFVGVTDDSGHTNSNLSSVLCFSIWTTNQIWTNKPIRIVFPVQPEYAFQVDLVDTNGNVIQKTEAGKRVGSKFLEFNENSFFVPSTGQSTEGKIKSQRTIVMAKRPPFEIFRMFRPRDLFKVEKPGCYTLRIYFQIVAPLRTESTLNTSTNILIRFSPIDYPIFQN